MSKARVAVLTLLVSASSVTAQDNVFQAVWQPGVRGADPSGAVVMGQENNGDPLYVCRGQHEGGTHPGKYVMSDGFCHIGWGGHVVRLGSFELLMRIQGEWGPPGQPGRTPYATGSESGQALKLCRASHQGGLHPGKLVQGKCNVAFADSEVVATEFTVFYASVANEVSPGNVVATANDVRANSEVRAANDASAVGDFSPDWRGLTPWEDRAMLATATSLGVEADGGPLYVCRVEWGDGYRTGASSGGTCSISWEGQAARHSNFWLLHGVRGEWGASDQLDRWAFAPSTDSSNAVLLCRALHGAGKYPGTLTGRACRIVDGYQEAEVTRYELFYRTSPGVPAVQWTTPRDPANAARGAAVLGTRHTGQPAHACRVRHEGGVFTGEYEQENGTCIFMTTYGSAMVITGKEVDGRFVADVTRSGLSRDLRRSTTFELLTVAEGEWVSPSSLADGQQIYLTGNVDGRPTMLCRIQYRGATNIGWALVDGPPDSRRHEGLCYFADDTGSNIVGRMGEVLRPNR